jgi:hypothetical protein
VGSLSPVFSLAGVEKIDIGLGSSWGQGTSVNGTSVPHFLVNITVSRTVKAGLMDGAGLEC